MLTRKYSLKGKRLFNKIYKTGKRKRTNHFGICSLKNDLDHSRFGIVISAKKEAKAVNRNKIKRLAKTYISNHKTLFNQSQDVIITLLKPLEEISKDSVEKEMGILLK